MNKYKKRITWYWPYHTSLIHAAGKRQMLNRVSATKKRSDPITNKKEQTQCREHDLHKGLPLVIQRRVVNHTVVRWCKVNPADFHIPWQVNWLFWPFEQVVVGIEGKKEYIIHLQLQLGSSIPATFLASAIVNTKTRIFISNKPPSSFVIQKRGADVWRHGSF